MLTFRTIPEAGLGRGTGQHQSRPASRDSTNAARISHTPSSWPPLPGSSGCADDPARNLAQLSEFEYATPWPPAARGRPYSERASRLVPATIAASTPPNVRPAIKLSTPHAPPHAHAAAAGAAEPSARHSPICRPRKSRLPTPEGGRRAPRRTALRNAPSSLRERTICPHPRLSQIFLATSAWCAAPSFFSIQRNFSRLFSIVFLPCGALGATHNICRSRHATPDIPRPAVAAPPPKVAKDLCM